MRDTLNPGPTGAARERANSLTYRKAARATARRARNDPQRTRGRTRGVDALRSSAPGDDAWRRSTQPIPHAL